MSENHSESKMYINISSSLNLTTSESWDVYLMYLKICLNFLVMVYTFILNFLLVDYLKSKPIVAQTVLDKCHVYWAINRGILSFLVNTRESLILLPYQESTCL